MPGIMIKGDMAALRGALGRIAALGRSPGPVLEAAGAQIVLNTRRRIERGVDPQGNPWKPLNPLYAIDKTGPGILRGADYSTTGLWRSITRQVRGNTLVWGSNKIYARIHQLGGVIRPKNARALFFRLGEKEVMVGSVTIPARPYLGFTAEDREDLVGELDDYLRRALSGR